MILNILVMLLEWLYVYDRTHSWNVTKIHTTYLWHMPLLNPVIVAETVIGLRIWGWSAARSHGEEETITLISSIQFIRNHSKYVSIFGVTEKVYWRIEFVKFQIRSDCYVYRFIVIFVIMCLNIQRILDLPLELFLHWFS